MSRQLNIDGLHRERNNHEQRVRFSGNPAYKIVCSLLACVIPAFAGSITIENPSFEMSATTTSCGLGFTADCFYSVGTPFG